MNTKEIKKKIDKVFVKLDKQGIIGKQDFWCCQTCGSSAMLDYEKEYDGYVFYHNQDMDTLKSDKYTYLSFGSFRDVPILDVANKIVKAFEEGKINVKWNGDVGTRIQIQFKK